MTRAYVASLVGLLLATTAMAAIPHQINVQGRLLSAGSPMNGPHPAVFTIYDNAIGGAPLWTEGSALEVQGGLFSAILGSTAPIPSIVFDSQPRWLEITVDGETLAPRLLLASSAFSFRAQRADTADVVLSGSGGGGAWETDGSSVWRPNGNVGIGTNSPGELLHLENGTGPASALLVRSYVPGTGSLGKLQFQNVLATDAGIAAEIEAVRPVATWGQESALLFKTNPGSPSPALVERMRITKDGNVGIGTATPQDMLEVAGNVTIGPYDGTLNDVVLKAAGGCPNCGSNSEGGSHLVLRSGIGTGSAASGDIVFEVSDNVIYGNQVPHAILEAMRIQAGTRNVSMNGDLAVAGTKCRVVHSNAFGDLYYNAVESDFANFTSSGRAFLKHGRCHVELDQRWLAGVTIDARHPLDVVSVVFYGQHGNWYAVPGATGFDIIDPDGGSSEFCWTVQARQRGYEDITLTRPEPSAAN